MLEPTDHNFMLFLIYKNYCNVYNTFFELKTLVHPVISKTIYTD